MTDTDFLNKDCGPVPICDRPRYIDSVRLPTFADVPVKERKTWEITCIVCGDTFTAVARTARYCSQSCINTDRFRQKSKAK